MWKIATPRIVVSVLGLQFMIGTFCGWLPPIMAKLTNDPNSEFHISLDEASWFASAQDIGRLAGPFVSFLLVDYIGRKHTLVAVAVIYFVVWTSVIFVRNILTLGMLRILFGLGNSINDVVAGIYTTENCSPYFRGIIGSLVFFIFFAAILVECVIATYVSYTCTAIINTVVAGCVFSTLYFCTETPYFLVMKGRLEEATENLIWLAGSEHGSEEIDEELRKIELSIETEKQKKRSFKALFSSAANVKGIILAVSMSTLGIAVGPNAYTTYASFVFPPSETLTSREYTILYSAVQFVAVTISPFVIEKIDRRSLMIGGFVGVTFSQMCSCLLTYLRGRGYQVMCYPWLIFGTAAAFCLCNALRAPAEFALRGELLPLSVRAMGSSMAVAAFSLTAFSLNKSFLTVAERFGIETNFLLYSAMGFLAVVFFYNVLPETRGKTLHELHSDELTVISDKKLSSEEAARRTGLP